ncbi:MFS transporter [Paraliobacillus sediminis]|uniref:MFS transporter n=1 Tax=Paraliobacillus sediminis TaxID=1885916 RepID=UPI000E3C745A|nr:MFS transporter [Paraliobacillus sediminis]
MAKEDSLVPLKMLLFSFHGANTIIISFLPLLLQYKGLDGKEIGWVLAVGPTVSIFSQPFWGYMSDKYQTVKRILLICLIGLLISSSVFFQMTTLPLLLTLAGIFYFFTAPIGALADSLSQRRADALHISFGTIRTWGSIGFATSSLLIGELLEVIGIKYLLVPYLFMGGLALLVCFKLKDVTVKVKPIQFRDLKKLIQNYPFIIFLGLILLITITHRANDSYIGIFIAQLGGSESLIGISWFVGVASEALVFAFAARWFRKYHPLIFIIGAGLLYTLRWFLFGIVDSPILVVVLQFMHGLSFGVFYLAAFQYVTRLIPQALQSTGHLLFMAVFFGISGIVGSLGGGALIDSVGGNTMYFYMGWMALLGTIFITIYHILPYGKE